MSRDEYVERLRGAWRALLDSDGAMDEAVRQKCIEKHPSLLWAVIGALATGWSLGTFRAEVSK